MENISVELIVAQIFGTIAVIFYAFSSKQKTKKGILFYHGVANFLYSIQYLLLGAFPAVGTNSMGVLKNCVFYSYDKKGKKAPVYILLIYISIITSLGILTFKNIFCIIPIFWSILSAYATWQNDLKKFRVFTGIIVTAMLIYNSGCICKCDRKRISINYYSYFYIQIRYIEKQTNIAKSKQCCRSFINSQNWQKMVAIKVIL